MCGVGLGARGAGPGTVSPRTAVNFFLEILRFNIGKVVFTNFLKNSPSANLHGGEVNFPTYLYYTDIKILP